MFNLQQTAKECILKIQRLFEAYLAKKRHDNGTYVSAEVSEESGKKIFDWAKKKSIDGLIESKDYHSTIIYSRKGVPQVEGMELPEKIEGKTVGWHIFPTQDGGKCLALDIESPVLTNLHEHIMKEYGATYDYDEYKPHITVTYDYKETEAPKTFPKMKVVFDSFRIEGLDPDKKFRKAK
jgi:hypothetical protein